MTAQADATKCGVCGWLIDGPYPLQCDCTGTAPDDDKAGEVRRQLLGIEVMRHEGRLTSRGWTDEARQVYVRACDHDASIAALRKEIERLTADLNSRIAIINAEFHKLGRIGPDTPDNSMVICPHCTSQFVAISCEDQKRRAHIEACLEKANYDADGWMARALAAEQRAATAELDSARLEYLCRHMPGRASRIIVGELSDTGNMNLWRERIDSAISTSTGEKG